MNHLDKNAILKRYEERYDIYKTTADVIVENNSKPDSVVSKILEVI